MDSMQKNLFSCPVISGNDVAMHGLRDWSRLKFKRLFFDSVGNIYDPWETNKPSTQRIMLVQEYAV